LEKNSSITVSYRIHDIGLTLTTNNPFILSSIDLLLECFKGAEQFAEPQISLSLFDSEEAAGIPCSVPEGSKLVYSHSQEKSFDWNTYGVAKLGLYVDPGNSTYVVDLGNTGILSSIPYEGKVSGYILEPERINPIVLSNLIFMFILSEMLRIRGYFPVHCSTVEREGKGIIFPGFSGAGKTTACIALIRKGFGFLGDDRPILRYTGDGHLEVLSFPEDIDATDNTIKIFSELKDKTIFKDNKNLTKKSFKAEDIYPGSVRDSCIPKVILFPEIYPGKESSLEELSKIEALTRFIPHSMVVINKETAGRHFDLIFDLVKSCGCYELKFGSDVDALGRLVEKVL
jgi:hypothetical protein